MTDFQQCDLASARILSPAAGHEAEERQFPFPSSPLGGTLRSYSPSEDRAGCMPAGAEGAASSCWCPVPPPARKHTQNPPACHSTPCGFGIFPRRARTAARGWQQRGFHAVPGVEEEEEEGGRCRRWGAGIAAERKEPAPSSGRHLRSPAPRQQKLHVPASRGPPPAMQDGERLPRAGGHPRREGGHRCGEAALLREGSRSVFSFGCAA